MSDKITHNLNESYLQSLTEEQRINEMKEWSAKELVNYLSPNGTMTADEFKNLAIQKISDKIDELDRKIRESVPVDSD